MEGLSQLSGPLKHLHCITSIYLSKMLSKMFTPTVTRSTWGLVQVWKTGGVRNLATVQTSSTGRVPQFTRKGTPVSRERATFTIKVG